jgi:GntP family gluconate:H+ symporter
MGSFSASDSMMSTMGFTSPMAAILVCMAIGAGAMTVSHANDSYFWVVTNFGEMTVDQGYKTQTMVTLVMGVVDVLFIWILSLFLL